MEHDLQSLVFNNYKFSKQKIKCLMAQLLEGVAHMHGRNIIHRDLKGGNLLLNNKGELKIADFGLAKFYNKYVPLTTGVVTHYYRAPEIFYGSCKYNEKIDIWSIGCIFGELLLGKMLFRSKTDKKIEHLIKIYELLGNPQDTWPEVRKLQLWQPLKPAKIYQNRIISYMKANSLFHDEDAFDLLKQFLAYNPAHRISAEKALHHPYFCDLNELNKRKLFHDLKDKGIDYHPISFKNHTNRENKKRQDRYRDTGDDYRRPAYDNKYDKKRNEFNNRGEDYYLRKRESMNNSDNNRRWNGRN